MEIKIGVMKMFFLCFAFLYVAFSFAQIPVGYYDSAQGLYGQPLKQALHDMIAGCLVVRN